MVPKISKQDGFFLAGPDATIPTSGCFWPVRFMPKGHRL